MEKASWRRSALEWLRENTDATELENLDDHALGAELIAAQSSNQFDSLDLNQLVVDFARHVAGVLEAVAFAPDPPIEKAYAVFGLEPGASLGQARQRFVTLSRQAHPDFFKNPDARRIMQFISYDPERLTQGLNLKPEAVDDYLENQTLAPFHQDPGELSAGEKMLYALGYYCVGEHVLSHQDLQSIRWYHCPETIDDPEQRSDLETTTKADPLARFAVETGEWILNCLTDTEFLQRLDDPARQDRRSRILEQLQATANQHFQAVRLAWAQIKGEAKTRKLAVDLAGFDWQPREETMQHPHVTISADYHTAVCRQALHDWNDGRWSHYLAQFSKDEQEAAITAVISDEELFHRFVPADVDPDQYGIIRFQMQDIPLENEAPHATISRQVEYEFRSGKKHYRGKPGDHPPFLAFDFKVNGSHRYPYDCNTKACYLKPLVIQFLKAQGQPFPPALFYDLADKFLWDEDKTQMVANMVAAKDKTDDIMEALGYTLPRYDKHDHAHSKMLNRDEIAAGSNRPLHEILTELREVAEALDEFRAHSLSLGYDAFGNHEFHAHELVVKSDGSWEIHHSFDESSGATQVFTLTPEEVTLIQNMVLGPSLTST